MKMKLLSLCVAVSSSVYGQATYGTIFGTVTDSSGARLSNVKITVISQDRGITFSATTNESGNYSKTQLPAGATRWTLRVRASSGSSRRMWR